MGLGFAAAVIILIVSLAVGFATRFDPFGHAQAAFDRRDYRTALRAARDYLKDRPGDAHASLMAARCLTRLGLVRQAEDQYQSAGRLTLDDLQDRAHGFFLLGEPDHAAKAYQEILARSPDNVLALKRFAAVRMGQKQWREVLALAERLLRIPSEQVAGHTMAAIGHHESKHYGEAVASAERVLQLDPDLKVMPLPPALFWNNLALDLMGEGRTADARAYLERALKRSDDAGLMELLGLAYHLDGKTDQAERCWRQALSWDPDNVNALLGLGRLSLSRQHWDEAVRILGRAAELSPDNVEPIYGLGQAHRHLGNIKEAERHEVLAARLRRSKPPVGGMGAMPTSGGPNVDVREPVR